MYYDILLLGIIIGLFYSEFTGYSPAGVVTAGYFAIYIKTPERIAVTLVLALITFAVCKLLGGVVILYGRRSFAAAVFMSALLSYFFIHKQVLPFNVAAVGYIIPALIARDFDRQGPVKTLLSLGTVTGLTAAVLLLMGHPVM